MHPLFKDLTKDSDMKFSIAGRIPKSGMIMLQFPNLDNPAVLDAHQKLVNIPDEKGFYPLHYVIHSMSDDRVKQVWAEALLQRGASPESKDPKGNDVIFYTQNTWKAEIMKMQVTVLPQNQHQWERVLQQVQPETPLGSNTDFFLHTNNPQALPSKPLLSDGQPRVVHLMPKAPTAMQGLALVLVGVMVWRFLSWVKACVQGKPQVQALPTQTYPEAQRDEKALENDEFVLPSKQQSKSNKKGNTVEVITEHADDDLGDAFCVKLKLSKIKVEGVGAPSLGV